MAKKDNVLTINKDQVVKGPILGVDDANEAGTAEQMEDVSFLDIESFGGHESHPALRH